MQISGKDFALAHWVITTSNADIIWSNLLLKIKTYLRIHDPKFQDLNLWQRSAYQTLSKVFDISNATKALAILSDTNVKNLKNWNYIVNKKIDHIS